MKPKEIEVNQDYMARIMGNEVRVRVCHIAWIDGLNRRSRSYRVKVVETAITYTFRSPKRFLRKAD